MTTVLTAEQGPDTQELRPSTVELLQKTASELGVSPHTVAASWLDEMANLHRTWLPSFEDEPETDLSSGQ